MKVKILGKYIGSTGIKSILVATESKECANDLAINASYAGATKDQILKLITSKDYNGVLNYSFFLNCSNFTFEKVEKFGILECDAICGISEKGYLYAKIKVVDKIEQVNGYEAPENYEAVSGWNIPAPSGAIQSTEPAKLQGEPMPVTNFENILTAQPEDLPF